MKKRTVRVWTCQRVTAGVRCGAKNPSRTRKCRKCGKPRPARRQPAHMVALNTDYAAYVELNGSERCGICGAERTAKRRLDRDHDHATGRPRGLLCWACNRQLRTWATVEWLRAAADYLERTK